NFNGQLDYNERDGDATPPNDDGDTELDLGWIAYLTCYTPEEDIEQGNQDNNNQDSNNDQSSNNQSNQNQNNNQQQYARVNVNTASEEVLAALFGGGDDATRIALDIIDYRESAENGIEQISDLTDKGVMTSDDFSKIENYITVSSDVFTVYCVAAVNRGGKPGARITTEVVLKRGSRPHEVLFSYQGTSN
ncbi:MAG: general secretion pathway protein GspK, partial [Candidatus Zixiibacteriota bacterium]